MTYQNSNLYGLKYENLKTRVRINFSINYRFIPTILTRRLAKGSAFSQCFRVPLGFCTSYAVRLETVLTDRLGDLTSAKVRGTLRSSKCSLRIILEGVNIHVCPIPVAVRSKT
jgi:hypothetical protein